jgi:hypothetical protein
VQAVLGVTLDLASARASDAGDTTMATVKSATDADVSCARLNVCRIGPQDLRDAVAKGSGYFLEYIKQNLYCLKTVLQLA